jgi:hypothetical protein
MTHPARIGLRLSPATRAGALLAALLALAGCGQQMEAPPLYNEPAVVPVPGTYNLKTVWDLSAPSDLAIFGPYLFVIEDHQRVAVYFKNYVDPRRPSMVAPFADLVAPVQIALAKRDSLFVVVADSGDMRCKIYYWLGGRPLHSFTDSLWASFRGLAADRDLTVFVADDSLDAVWAYDRWGYRRRRVTEFGTGSGYVIDPCGLAVAGDTLVLADHGKNWVQRLRADTTSVPVFVEPIGRGEDPLLGPRDVAVAADPADGTTYIYIADTGNDRVLKFTMAGEFRDVVCSPQKIPLSPPLTRPGWICSTDSLVFVSDPRANRVVLLELKPL